MNSDNSMRYPPKSLAVKSNARSIKTSKDYKHIKEKSIAVKSESLHQSIEQKKSEYKGGFFVSPDGKAPLESHCSSDDAHDSSSDDKRAGEAIRISISSEESKHNSRRGG